MRQLLLIRHREYYSNSGNLTPDGVNASKNLGRTLKRRLKNYLISEIVIISSWQERCKQTANLIAKALGIKYQTENAWTGYKDEDGDWYYSLLSARKHLASIKNNYKVIIYITHAEFLSIAKDYEFPVTEYNNPYGSAIQISFKTNRKYFL